MGAGLLDNAKKAFIRSSSSSKAISNHPLPSDMSRGGLEIRYNESPKKEGAAIVRKDVPSRGGGATPRERDVARAQNFQTTREPTQVFARTETTPPESLQGSSYRTRQNSMHEFRALAREKKALQSELLAMRDNLNTVLSASDTQVKEIWRLRTEVKRLDSVVMSTVSEAGEARKKVRDLERETRRQDEDIRNLQQRLHISEERHSQTTKLLDDRTAELKGAQVFLTTADRYSGADIIKMAESLNAEIFQSCAAMAELLVETPVMEDPTQQRQYIQAYNDKLDHGRRVVGLRLFDHLAAKSSEIRVDPLPVQLALQALFTWWCGYETDRFCEGPAGNRLKEIYRRIYKSETQAVAGRWRVMTSVQTMNSDTSSEAPFVYDVILGLMCICGWFTSDKSQRAILSIQQAVSRVERMWKILKAAIMQEITASEITIVSVGPGRNYDPVKMDDMYMDTRDGATTNPDQWGQRILCTVGVGLRRKVSKRCENGTMKVHQEVILKPKVALASVLADAESPIMQEAR